MGIKIKLRGGPCDGESHDGVRVTAKRVTRSSKHPGVFYHISDEYDEVSGRRIFVYKAPTQAQEPKR